jgi:hypothetical protein
MSDEPFYAPNRKPAPPPERKPGEHLWGHPEGRPAAIASSAIMASGALRSRSNEREFLYGRRWPTRALALEQGDEQKAAYLGKGGILIA